MKKGLFLVAMGLMSWMMAGSAFAGPFGHFARPRQQQQRELPQNNDERDLDNNNSEKERAEKEHAEKERAEKERGERNIPNPQAPAQAPAARENMEARPGPAGNPGLPPQQAGQPFGGRGGARMSVEERQKLRRQINEAGRSLYTPPPGNK